MRQPVPAPFIVGVPRSGTTLLRLMLDAHPALAIPTETHFAPELIAACRRERLDGDAVLDLVVSHPRWLPFELEPAQVREHLPAEGPVDAAQALRGFYRAYADAQGKPRWGDKTPNYLRHMSLLAEVLPEASFVHVIRDGRDVALSMTSARLTMPDTIERAAQSWNRKLRRGLEAAGRVSRYLEVRYEELVLDPETVLRRTCEFVDLDFDPAMLAYHERAPERMRPVAIERPRSGGRPPLPSWYVSGIHAMTSRPPDPERAARWRREMSPNDVSAFEQCAGDLLAELGYELAGADEAVGRRKRTPGSDDG